MSWGHPPEGPDPFPRDGWGEGPAPLPWSPGGQDPDLDPLDAAFARAAAQAHQRLSGRLEMLVTRRIPVRGLEPGPVTGVARMRWADSTVMLVTAARPGELSRVLRTLTTRRSLTLASYRLTDVGLHLSLRGATGRQPVGLIVVGPDQPD